MIFLHTTDKRYSQAMNAAGVIGLIIGVVISYVILYAIIRSAVTSGIRAARADLTAKPAPVPGALTPSEEKFFGKDVGTP